MGDFENLVEMGFEPRRVTLALKKTGGLQDAITWLDEHSETPIDELEAKFGNSGKTDATKDTVEDDEVEEDQAALEGNAQSLRCTDCGKLFSTPELAQYHATKTEHQNFEQSTEQVKPLTAEEKAAKLKELREKLAAKRAAQAKEDAEIARKNEAIRRQKDQESERLKEELKKKEQLKEIEKQKKEKLADIAARKKVEAQIKAAQEERRKRAAEAKAAREGRAPPVEHKAAVPATENNSAANYDQARLQLRMPSGQPPVIKTFPADTTLFEVAAAVQADTGFEPNSFTMTFPRRTFTREEYGLTLKEAKLVPSAALILG